MAGLRSRVSFEEALAYGEEGEHTIARMLMSRGVVVSPLYQFDKTGAPGLLYEDVDGTLAKLTQPDLTCWSAKRHFFAEVKRKNRWVDFHSRRPCQCGQKRGLETGFDTRLYQHYSEVSLITGAEISLFFLHEKSPDPRSEPHGVYSGELSKMTQHSREWDGKSELTGARVGKPETLFAAHCLRFLWSLEDLEPARPAPTPALQLGLGIK